MTDGTPPDPSAPPPSPPYAVWSPAPTPTPTLPWWRTTPAIVIGAILCLFFGGIGGLIVAVAGDHVLGTGDDSSTAPDVRTFGPDGDLSVFGLGPGQCARPDIDDVTALDESDAVDCNEAHAVEVFGHVDAPSIGRIGSAVDRDDIADFGDHACFIAFEAYVGTKYDDSKYDYLAVIPTAGAWDGGGRTIYCVLYPYDTDTTKGSAYGSGG